MYELYHHGVKGQKWGVRRYQNPDGSLTTAGKRRRAAAIIASPGGYALYRGGKAISNASKRAKARREEIANYTDEQKRDIAKDVRSDARTTYKYRKYLSDNELEKRVNRLNKEKQLKDLANDEGYEKYKSKTQEVLIKYGLTKAVSATLGPEAGAVVASTSFNNNSGNKKKKKKKK